MIPWNPDASAQDHLAAAREGRPCDLCGGPGWLFGGPEWGLVWCADCSDDGKSEPQPLLVLRLSRAPEPWLLVLEPDTEASEARRPHSLAAYWCAQCDDPAAGQLAPPGWWACRCLAAAETAAGVVVLRFPQPVRMG